MKQTLVEIDYVSCSSWAIRFQPITDENNLSPLLNTSPKTHESTPLGFYYLNQLQPPRNRSTHECGGTTPPGRRFSCVVPLLGNTNRRLPTGFTPNYFGLLRDPQSANNWRPSSPKKDTPLIADCVQLYHVLPEADRDTDRPFQIWMATTMPPTHRWEQKKA